MFITMTALACLSAFWLRSPVAYLATSIGVGVAWLMFLIGAWRLRSEVATAASTVVIIVAHQFLRAWLVPQSLFTLVQGVLVTGASAALLMWLLRGRIVRICRFTDETQPS
jgi:hypothetical protein